MKEKLTGALGSVGVIIYYIVACLLLFMPLNVLRFPWWIDIILMALMIFTTVIAAIVEFVLWAWSLVIVITQWPLDVFTIIYYVALAIYVFSALYPKAVSFVSYLANRKQNKLF